MLIDDFLRFTRSRTGTMKKLNPFSQHRQARTGFHRKLILAVVLSPVAWTNSAESASPDPVALLRGIEEIRAKIKSGRMEITVVRVKLNMPNEQEFRCSLEASFEGGARRIDQRQRSLFIDGTTPAAVGANEKKLRAMGYDREAFVRLGLGHWKETDVHSAYDGIQFMQYSEDLGATVKDPSKGSADYAFDPRILGITANYLLSNSVPLVLTYHDAKSVALIGRDEVDGHPTWKVHVHGKNEQDRHFWIDESNGFKVRKFEDLGNLKSTVLSRYDENRPEVALPTWVEVSREYKGLPIERMTFAVDKEQYNVAVDPKHWTLAGLGMPLGQMVIDQRIHQVIGHFDGTGLTSQATDAIEKGREAERKPTYWAIALGGLIALAVVAAVVVKRRNWLLEGEA